MFEDINIMQKEIEKFRTNMLASTELVEGIEKLIEENKNTQELVEKIANQYQKELRNLAESAISSVENQEQATVEQIKALSEKAINDVVSEVKAANDPYIVKMGQTSSEIEEARLEIKSVINSIEKTCKETVDEIKTSSEENIADVVNNINSTNKQYIDRLNAVEGEMNAVEKELTDKYNDFVKRLENTKVEEVVRICGALKKSVESKLIVGLAGIGVAIILEIIQIVMK